MNSLIFPETYPFQGRTKYQVMFKRSKNIGPEDRKKKSPKNGAAWRIINYGKSILIAVLLALLIKATVVEAYHVPSSSMEKTIMTGDYLIGNRFIYGIKIPFTDIRLPAFREPQRGDIIIFRPHYNPHENFVKRLIGVPGDTIQLIDKKIYINGKLFEDSPFTQYISNKVIPKNHMVGDPYRQAYRQYGVSNDGYRPFAPFRDNSDKIIIPKGKYFVMGDNRDNSLDSRMWGFVDRDCILGKVLVVLWSWDTNDSNAPEVSWKNPLTVISNLGYNIMHFPQRMRWDRILNTPN